MNTKPLQKVLVWDAPVRAFHWLIVLNFVGAYLTAEHDSWRQLHITFGYTMAGLVVFRLIWGLIGTRYARFSAFVRGPRQVLDYFRCLLNRQPGNDIGHNPAGALAIVAMLGMTILVTTTGYATYKEFGGELLEELHEGLANAMLLVVAVHIAGVLLSSWMHDENLVRAMIDGRKRGNPKDGIHSAWYSIALVLILAVLGFWWMQWRLPI